MTSRPWADHLFKIATESAWAEACRSGIFAGSTADQRDGFIHLSARHQIAETARKHFLGQSDLLLIAFDAASFGSALKWEPSRGGDRFPHLYAPLPVSAALWTRPVPLREDGVPELTWDVIKC